jgi:hypothetical protein
MTEKNGGTVHKLSPVTIARVAFGVRYESQFGVLNHVGEVVDYILRTEGSPFDSDVFPNREWRSQPATVRSPCAGTHLQL